MIDIRLRTLEKIAYHYHLKNKKRSAKQNWKLAEKLFKYIDKRKERYGY